MYLDMMDDDCDIEGFPLENECSINCVCCGSHSINSFEVDGVQIFACTDCGTVLD